MSRRKGVPSPGAVAPGDGVKRDACGKRTASSLPNISTQDILPPAPGSLDDLAIRIRAKHEEFVGSIRTSLTLAIEAGELLIEAKAQCGGHGRWLPWLESVMPARTASHYMRLARSKDEIGNTVADLTVRGAMKLLAPPVNDNEPDEIVARGEKEILDIAQSLRAEKTQQRREVRLERIAAQADAGPLPQRKFPVIYADPPWRYEFSATSTRAIEQNYETMSLEDICALPVGDIACNDAMLFLWVPPAILEQAFPVIAAWGFSYRSGMVWDKDKIGAGHWVRQQHEHLLICRRGEFPTPAPDQRPRSVLRVKRREHSRKPDEAYELIERMFPDLPKIELFARNARPSWACWGNQAPEAAA